MDDLLYYIVCLFGISIVILIMMNSYSLIFTSGVNKTNKSVSKKNKKKVRFNEKNNQIKRFNSDQIIAKNQYTEIDDTDQYNPSSSYNQSQQYQQNNQRQQAPTYTNLQYPILTSDKKQPVEPLQYSADISENHKPISTPNQQMNPNQVNGEYNQTIDEVQPMSSYSAENTQSMSGDNYFADGGLSPFTDNYGSPF
jgi:FtsZ-interacting cell division protein ZipA